METLSARQELILESVIREYTDTAKPVGSNTLCGHYGLDISPATIRSEMKSLAEMGLVGQMHISGGRVPTENGYRYFVDKLLGEDNLGYENQVNLEKICRQNALKDLAKTIAQMTRGLTFCSSESESEFHRFGFEALFMEMGYSEEFLLPLFNFLDKSDEYIEDCWELTEKDPLKIFIGSEMPFGELRFCSAILGRFNAGKSLAISISPMRTKYHKNIAIFKHLINL